MKRITSRQNPVIGRYRDAARGEDREVLLDGPHLIREALAAQLTILHALVVAEARARPEIAGLLERLEADGVECAEGPPAVLALASPVRSPSGIVAVGSRPADGSTRLYAGPSPLVVIACGVQDPGNLGAMVRVADAAGASGFVAAGESANPFSWKALRGSMGSALRLPIAVLPDTEQALVDAHQHRCRLVAAVPREGVSLFEADLRGPLAILVGSEGHGLPASMARRAEVRVTIPMQQPVESINAAIATALIVYEATRQRLHARGAVS